MQGKRSNSMLATVSTDLALPSPGFFLLKPFFVRFETPAKGSNCRRGLGNWHACAPFLCCERQSHNSANLTNPSITSQGGEGSEALVPWGLTPVRHANLISHSPPPLPPSRSEEGRGGCFKGPGPFSIGLYSPCQVIALTRLIEPKEIFMVNAL